ncbi:hypothetical protein M153_3510004321 [Pseudoloma neurophilia]|uniref:Uncharacterized protein n=1 Tax=Pseudoloma neurophilia TaxID=146866 RepID=A0A0R0LY21_9MICR|nr:hypothetical protein M153_3510004321 [Pseudoloma neurophilia]
MSTTALQNLRQLCSLLKVELSNLKRPTDLTAANHQEHILLFLRYTIDIINQKLENQAQDETLEKLEKIFMIIEDHEEIVGDGTQILRKLYDSQNLFKK